MHLNKARALAKENGDSEVASEALVNYGIVNAELKWDKAMKNVLSKMGTDVSYD